MATLKKSAILLGLLTVPFVVNADLPKQFDYSKASTNYADNTSSSASSVANPYYFGG